MKIEVQCLLVPLLWIYKEYSYEDYFLFFLSIDIQCDEMLWIFNDQYIYKNAEERFLDASRDSLFSFFVKTRNTYYFLPFFTYNRYIFRMLYVHSIFVMRRYITIDCNSFDQGRELFGQSNGQIVTMIKLVQRVPLSNLLPRRLRHLKPMLPSLTVTAVRTCSRSNDAGSDNGIFTACVQHAYLTQT